MSGDGPDRGERVDDADDGTGTDGPRRLHVLTIPTPCRAIR